MPCLPMTVVPADTTQEAAWVQIKVLRRLSPEQRLLQTLRISDSMRALTAAGVRARHPDYNDEEVRLTVIRMWLGDDLFRKAFPDVKLPI